MAEAKKKSMGNNTLVLLSFPTSLPGTWILYLIPGSALVLLMILVLSRKNEIHNPIRRKHLLTGSLVLFLLQVIGFAASLSCRNYGSIQLSTFQTILLSTAALTILWLSWTFLEERKNSLQTGITLALTGGILSFAVLSLLLFRVQSLFPIFSQETFHIIWQIISLLLALSGLILILIRRPDQWIIGALILACLGIGCGLELLLGNGNPDAVAWSQLAQAISLPWLLILLQRLTQKEDPPHIQDQTTPDQPVDTKPELVDLLLQINLQEKAADRFRATVRALSLSLVADICYLVRILPDGDHIELIAGYDLIREIFLPTPTLHRGELLHIMDAWADQRVLRLSQIHADAQDAVTLTLLLKYHRIGNLLAYPLHLPNEPAAGGVIIFSPYTSKLFDSNSLHLLDEVQATLSRILFGKNPIDRVNAELERNTKLAAILRQTAESLSQVLSEKEALITTLKTDLQQYKAKYQMEKMDSVQQMEALHNEIQSLRQQPPPQEGLLRRVEQLSAQLRQLTEERDQLKTALVRAEARIKHLESETGQTGPTRISMDNQIISLDSIAANLRLQIAAQLQNNAQTLEIINPEGRQMIKTDPELLQTALQGLLENAMIITPLEGAIQLRLDVSLETGMLIAEVTDHGEGLTHDEQTLLFSATEATIPGIGSLPSIRDAIRAIRVLNGKIWLRSTKHLSTTFRVQVPIRIID
jgi:predicted  nucleic acid-binding Zn-ribbon protein